MNCKSEKRMLYLEKKCVGRAGVFFCGKLRVALLIFLSTSSFAPTDPFEILELQNPSAVKKISQSHNNKTLYL